MSVTKCKYMDAAYPTLSAEDCCEQMHRHEPRVFDLAKAMAHIFQPSEPSDEKIGWFLDDADADVDDFTPTPESWSVEGLPGDDERPDIARRLRINGIEYVIQESEWEPAHPVARATYDSWQAGVS